MVNDQTDPPEGDADNGHDDDDQHRELSLEELGAAYARVAHLEADNNSADNNPADSNVDDAFVGGNANGNPPVGKDGDAATNVADPSPPSSTGASSTDASSHSSGDAAATDEDELTPTVEQIVEAALFVGHPDNAPVTAARISKLMRDVTPEEVIEVIERLNQSYRDNDQAFRIIELDDGYRMGVAPAVEDVRVGFGGRIREAKLSQEAIDVLALIAYQPGINLRQLDDRRGRESSTLCNQLARRQLITIEKIKPDAATSGGRAIPHYYPTERFLVLFGLESIEDLPLLEEGFAG